MFDLIVTGPAESERLTVPLEPGSSYGIGRDAAEGISVPWDAGISRSHVRIAVADENLQVERNSSATNPVFFQGQSVERCELSEGQHFVAGSTSFRLVRHGSDASPSQHRMVEEISFDRRQLCEIPFSDADKRIEVLTHLPEVIWGTRTDDDFLLRIAQLLLAGIPRAEGVAIVEPTDDGVNVLHWDRRDETAGTVRPSARLVRDAIERNRQSILHVWESSAVQDDRYTATAEFNWAFCTPVTISGEVARGLYVAGHQTPHEIAESAGSQSLALQADIRFTELAAEIVSQLRRLSSLERHQAGLRQFFAPPILQALGEDLNTDELAPRECEVTVLFCDLRGFSQQAESSAHDLTGLLARVSEALGVMTEQILRFGGVTGDFQGDAALGFWGWPFASEEAPLNACRAALGIRAAFEAAAAIPGHSLADFEMGIGIAHGRAVAGKIGTSEQVKVTVFGPVVNLASRLETMTSQLRVPILLDSATAGFARDQLPVSQGRTRRLGRILPVGMETPVTVSELLPPVTEYPLLSDEQLSQYEQGVDHFVAGQWDQAWECLHTMPAGDRAQDFLLMPIVQNDRKAPPDWDGVIRLTRK